MRQSTNWRGVAESQVWFRIVHVAEDGHQRALGDAIREQTVEIALGPKGAFTNGNVGTATRQLGTGQIVSALPAPCGTPVRSKEPSTPHVVVLLQKALEWQRQLDAGEVSAKAEIARREGISRARVTQIMAMLQLAPEIQQHVLSMPDALQASAITERALRPIARLDGLADQKAEFQQLSGPGRLDRTRRHHARSSR